MTLNQKFGYAFGAVYVLIGIAGFFVVSGIDFAARTGQELLIFEVNPLHNIVHILIGGLFIAGAAAGAQASRAMNGTIGVVYLAVGIIGFFLMNRSMDILALNMADNWLHIASGALALLVSMRREAAAART